MTALQTERFYPNLTTGHPRLDALGRHLGTTALAAGCAVCALGAGLAVAGTIGFLINPLTAGPAWQLLYAPILGTATWRLARWTWRLAHTIRARA